MRKSTIHVLLEARLGEDERHKGYKKGEGRLATEWEHSYASGSTTAYDGVRH